MIKKLVYAVLLIISASSLVASEINIYSYRQPFLIQPLTDAFTKETGIKVNVAYLRKGMIERMKAEGKRSPADVVLTVDISRLAAVVEADLTQPVINETLTKNIPAIYRDPDNHWFGLTTRARTKWLMEKLRLMKIWLIPNGRVEFAQDQELMPILSHSPQRSFIIMVSKKLKNG